MLSAALLVPVLFGIRASAPPPRAAAAAIRRFEQNAGQWPKDVRFVARTPHGTLVLGSAGARLHVRGADGRSAAIGLRWDAAARAIDGVERLPGVSNYLIGSDRERWRSGIEGFRRVRYAEVAPRVDLEFYGATDGFEYDLVVRPGGNPRALALDLDGVTNARVDTDGSIVFETSAGAFRQHRPIAFQERDGLRTPVEARYELRDGRIGFRTGAYNRSRALVIDPTFDFSTFLGGTAADNARAVKTDAAGHIYVTGSTASTDFPAAASLFSGNAGGTDAFVAKLTPDGASLVYATYLGGSGDDIAYGLGVTAAGSVYVGGSTASTDFPLMAAAGAANTGGSGFVTRLSDDGSTLIFSTYLGGAGLDRVEGLAIDGAGNAYVTGPTFSSDFPLQNALRTAPGGSFITKLTPGGAMVYSTYFGNPNVILHAIAIDPAGAAYVGGETRGVASEITPGAYRVTLGGGHCEMGFRPPLPFQPCLDGVVAKLTPSGSLAYGTYLRGDNEIGVSHDVVSGIVVDATANATVVGTTTSLSFPTTPGANRSAGVCPFSPCAPGRVFITKLNSDGTGLVSSATLGSASFFDSGTGIAVQSFVSPGGGPSPGIAIDALGQAVVTGWTKASDLPVVNAQQPRLASPGPLRLASNGSVATAIGAPPGSTAITKLTGAANGTLYALDNLRAAAFRSSDNGATWTLLEAPFAVGRDDLSLDPNDGTTLYTTAGKSADGGTTWTSFGQALTSAPLARPGVPNVLYATIFGGSPVSKSVNGGATWTSISHGIPFDPPGSLQITLSDPNVMYYLSPFVGLYGTVDDGALWTARTTPPDTAQTLAVNPSQPLTVYIGGSSGVWKSVNGGSTWTRTLPGGSFTNLLASSATLVFASTSEHALYVSVDGGDTWAPVEGASASISGADFSAPGVAFAISSPIPDGFVAALSATGALLYESYLGGVHTDIPYALTTTPDNAVVVAGSTGSPDFPNSNAVQPTYGGGNSDAFVTKLRFPQIVFSVDTPADQTTAFMPFKLGGWALDRGSASDDGIDGIHVWAFSAAGVPTFIGAPVPNVARPDVAAVYGSPFANAGFNVTVDGLTPGTYTFAIYPHSSVTSTFAPPRVMTITVAPGALAAIGVPANGSTTFGGANLGGWAIDRASTTDTGISTVHVWAYPNPGSGQAPIFLGVADYGVARPDVGAIFGSQFTNSGFNLTLPPLEPGPYLFVASPFSTMTNSFQAPATVLATAGPQQPFGAVDLPAANATVGSGFAVAGWAIDRSAPTGTGVSSVHVYAFAIGSSTPIFLGAATLGFARADIGAIFGSPFTPSGFAVATAPLPPGTYDVYTYARSTVSGYAAVRGVRVIVQ